MWRLAPGRALFRLQISTKSGKTEASHGPEPAKMLAGTTLGQARAMDGAGRLARSLRSLGPQADLKAAAIGAAVLLRERLGLRAARPGEARDRSRAAESPGPSGRTLPSEPRRRRLDRADAARQHRLWHRQGRSPRRLHGCAQRYPQCARQFGRIPHHHRRHQRPQAVEPGRGARDRRRQWPLLAVVSRRRHRARQAQGQSVDR